MESSVKRTGVVFTPKYISDFMVSFITESDKSKLKILEPSCGEGIFIDSLSNINNEITLHVNDINSEFIQKCQMAFDNKKIIYHNENFINFNKNMMYDIIIGNPPYVRIQNLEKTCIDLIKSEYNILSGSLDLYIYFILKCIDMLNDDGKLIFIIPNSFLFNKSCSKIKQKLIDLQYIEYIIDFKEHKIFNGYNVYTCIIVVNKKTCNRDFYYYKSMTLDYMNELNHLNYTKVKYKTILTSKCLLDYINIKCGLATLCDNIFIIDNAIEDDLFIYFTKGVKKYKVEKTIVKKVLKVSKNIEKYIIFPYDTDGNIYDNLDNYPECYNYLLEYKEKLKNRDKQKKTYEKWYAFGRKQGINMISGNRLFISSLVKNIKDNIIEKDIPLFYSGLYIEIKCEMSIDVIKQLLVKYNDKILDRCNVKSGGYNVITKDSFNISL